MDPETRRLSELLAPLTNYERLRPDRPRWSLVNMRALLARPGFVLPRGRLVQIGGSKGKGTTSLYLESLARSAGLRVGTYLSPHVQSLLERIRIDGHDVSEGALRAVLEPLLRDAQACGIAVTFFEAMTAAAVGLFAAHDVDLGVLEVGLGGRLDATTAVPVDAAVLTTVELEHTELLGDTVEAIAAEKSWIVRPDKPAFTGCRDAALRVVRAHAARVAAAVLVLDEHFAIEQLRDEGTGFRGVLRDADGGRQPFLLPGAALFELPALCLAYACLRRLWPGCAIPLQPVARPELRARFEVFECGDGQPLVLDGAHTAESMRCVRRELDRRFGGRPLAVLFASAVGKRWQEELRCLLPAVDRFFVTGLTGIPPVDQGAIVGWLGRQGARAASVASPEAGLRALAEFAGVRLVTGSFYLVGEVRSRIDLLGARAAR